MEEPPPPEEEDLHSLRVVDFAASMGMHFDGDSNNSLAKPEQEDGAQTTTGENGEPVAAQTGDHSNTDNNGDGEDGLITGLGDRRASTMRREGMSSAMRLIDEQMTEMMRQIVAVSAGKQLEKPAATQHHGSGGGNNNNNNNSQHHQPHHSSAAHSHGAHHHQHHHQQQHHHHGSLAGSGKLTTADLTMMSEQHSTPTLPPSSAAAAAAAAPTGHGHTSTGNANSATKKLTRKQMQDKKTPNSKAKKTEKTLPLQTAFELSGLPLVFAEALQQMQDTGDSEFAASVPCTVQNAALLCSKLQLSQLIPKPHTVDFSAYPKITSQILEFVQERCTNIRRLVIDRCVMFSGESLVSLATKMPKLRSLSIVGCVQLQDKDISDLAPVCRQLRKLNASECHIGDAAVKALSIHCSALRHLFLSSTAITNEALACFAPIRAAPVTSAAPTSHDALLQSTTTTTTTTNTTATTTTITRPCHQLEELHLSHCYALTDVGLAHLSNLVRLKTLDLDACRGITALGIASTIKKSPAVVDIRMALVSGVSDSALEAIAKSQPLLERLDLYSCLELSGVGVDALSRSCLSIKTLSLARCTGVSEDSVLRLVIRCTKLEILDISHLTSVTDECVRMISDCLYANLKRLTVNGCNAVTSESLALVVAASPKLELLEFVGVGNISAMDMEFLQVLVEERGEGKRMQLVH